MVNQTSTLARLKKEKDYEDKLASDLLSYYSASVEFIVDMTDEEKKKVKETLSAIASDSRRHSNMFGELIQMVLDNGENNY